MYKSFIKRLIDLIFAIIALPFICLVFIVVAPIIFSEDKGPVFYSAPRVGKKGKIFNMYKFRSMTVNSPDLRTADGSTYNSPSDPRVTKIGRILRKTSLDEIPQFINVLKGDMSLIGPRAHLADHFVSYDAYDDIHKKRLLVRPGITGYTQAYFRNSVSADEKLLNDVYYVDNLTFGMDMKIFFKTISSVLKHENVFVSGEKTEVRK